jgi:hypothetical protein|tara:strand:- start:56 stop:301 length:246 start_codon:yes stop_codon:yes gene_type:complete
MDVTNENAEDTPLLTKGDLAVAAFALSETFNAYLADYQAEEYGEMSKEQYETSLNHIRTAFVKFDTLLKAMSTEEADDSEV